MFALLCLTKILCLFHNETISEMKLPTTILNPLTPEGVTSGDAIAIV